MQEHGGVVAKYCFDGAPKEEADDDTKDEQQVNIADVFIGEKVIQIVEFLYSMEYGHRDIIHYLVQKQVRKLRH